MPVVVVGAFGTLFDVHAAMARHTRRTTPKPTDFQLTSFAP
jgi:hypothetical protein